MARAKKKSKEEKMAAMMKGRKRVMSILGKCKEEEQRGESDNLEEGA